jgi:hypothetical protein
VIYIDNILISSCGSNRCLYTWDTKKNVQWPSHGYCQSD